MLFRTLFPRECAICHARIQVEEDDNLCSQCNAELSLPIQKCIFCDTPGSFLCHLCKKSTIQSLIQQYKFSLRPYLAQTISQLMWQYSTDFFSKIPRYTTIIPMPSDRLRVAKRGYNLVSIIAKQLAHKSRFHFSDHYLHKKAFSIPQTDLSRDERLSNHQNSFFLQPKQLLDPQKKSLLFIDDVITTGRSFQKALQKLDSDQTNQMFGLFIAQS